MLIKPIATLDLMTIKMLVIFINVYIFATKSCHQSSSLYNVYCIFSFKSLLYCIIISTLNPYIKNKYFIICLIKKIKKAILYYFFFYLLLNNYKSKVLYSINKINFVKHTLNFFRNILSQ